MIVETIVAIINDTNKISNFNKTKSCTKLFKLNDTKYSKAKAKY